MSHYSLWLQSILYYILESVPSEKDLNLFKITWLFLTKWSFWTWTTTYCYTEVMCHSHSDLPWGTCLGYRISWISYKWRQYMFSESCYCGWRDGSFQAHNATQKPDGSTDIMEVHHMMDILLMCVCVFIYNAVRNIRTD
jgi:hypothetical protein